MNDNPTQAIKLLLPCAGFGKRVGSPPAKELLPSPVDGRPMIEFWLDFARDAAIPAVVITREEKQPLIDYVGGKEGIEVCIIPQSREWPESLLLAERYWGRANVVALPDSYLAPQSAVAALARAIMSGVGLGFLVFQQEDLSLWGGVAVRATSWWIGEKPRRGVPSSGREEHHIISAAWAWGCFGFSMGRGPRLLHSMLEAGQTGEWLPLAEMPAIIPLAEYRDLTR